MAEQGVQIDFEGNGGGNLATEPDRQDLGGGTTDINAQGKQNGGAGGDGNGGTGGEGGNGNGTGTEGNGGTGAGNGDGNGGEGGNNPNLSSTGDLEPGTEIEFEGQTYTVAENGDLVDSEGKVFKAKADIAAWLQENEITDGNGEQPLTIDSIRESVGIDITDEAGKPVDFTNDAAGVKSYIDSVLALKSNEVAQGAVNKLFADNPELKQFIDYVKVTGSARGFGEIPDRSNIKLDKDNATQQKAIIRMAAEEFGNKSMNESYIKYLEESGGLYDVAKEQLEALVGKDNAYREQLQQRAEAMRAKDEKDIAEYWQSVNDAIANRVIGGYKIPDSIVKEINGQKVTLTPDDFYKYVADAAEETEDGVILTGYQRDLNKLSKEEALAKELLDAWLMFTGGSYKDLIDMAVKEDKVRKLVIKSKEQRTARTVKITKPNTGKVNPDDIILS